MKLKTVKSSDLVGGIGQVVGVGVGLMLPNAIANSFAKVDEGATATDEQKKKKMYVNAAATLIGTYGALALDGKGTAVELVKALALGVAGGGVKGLAAHFLEKPVQALPAGTARTLLAGGLGCPCVSQGMPSYPTLAMPSYGMPSYGMPQTMQSTGIDLGNSEPIRLAS